MKNYTKKIPLELEHVQALKLAIENANYLYEEFMRGEQFPTDNGSDGVRWNYINKIVSEMLPTQRFQIEIMQRGVWKFLGIYDKETGFLYTMMRSKNLNNLRKSATSKLFHYTNVLSKLNDCLNEEYYVVNEQLSLLANSMYDEEDEAELEKILTSLTQKIEGTVCQYVLITFDISRGQITSIKGVIPSVGMSYYKEEVWNEALTAEYVLEEEITQSEVVEDVIFLERKPKLKRQAQEKHKINKH